MGQRHLSLDASTGCAKTVHGVPSHRRPQTTFPGVFKSAAAAVIMKKMEEAFYICFNIFDQKPVFVSLSSATDVNTMVTATYGYHDIWPNDHLRPPFNI